MMTAMTLGVGYLLALFGVCTLGRAMVQRARQLKPIPIKVARRSLKVK